MKVACVRAIAALARRAASDMGRPTARDPRFGRNT
jgi:hypothetical protein